LTCQGDRYGGRISVVGDITLGNNDTLVHVHSCHLESGQSNVEMVLESLVVREQQAAEMVNFKFEDELPVIITGDLNSPMPNIDPTIIRLEMGGYVNSFQGKNESERQVIQFDYLLSKPDCLFDADYCTDEQCVGYSDHLPYWATFHQ
jgi:endonuclease/exonuclease/phosphatase family metal-dependent hydrolase